MDFGWTSLVALVVKNSPANAGDTSSISGSWRLPGGWHDNPLQCSCLENPMDRGAWRVTVHKVTKNWTQLEWVSMHTSMNLRISFSMFLRRTIRILMGDGFESVDLFGLYYHFGAGNGNPLQYSCLENSMDGGAWLAIVHGVAKSRTWLSDFPFFLSVVPFGEGNGNPLQCSCLENPMDGGAWWATVCCCCQVTSVVSNSVRPHGLQPTRLLCPWDSAGKNTGVRCHFLLQGYSLWGCKELDTTKQLTHITLTVVRLPVRERKSVFP